MVYRSWSTYLEALASYKAAKDQCDAAIQQWNARLKSFDSNSSQTSTVNGLGCLTVIGAGIIVYF